MNCEKVLLIHSHEIALCYIGQVLYVHFYDVMFNLFQFYMLWANAVCISLFKITYGYSNFFSGSSTEETRQNRNPMCELFYGQYRAEGTNEGMYEHLILTVFRH